MIAQGAPGYNIPSVKFAFSSSSLLILLVKLRIMIGKL